MDDENVGAAVMAFGSKQERGEDDFSGGGPGGWKMSIGVGAGATEWIGWAADGPSDFPLAVRFVENFSVIHADTFFMSIAESGSRIQREGSIVISVC